MHMSAPLPQGVTVSGPVTNAFAQILTPEALAFVARLHRQFESRRRELLARREELMRTIARTAEEGRLADEDPTVDLADKAANSYTKEFLFGMTNTDRNILNMIEAALKRLRSL